MHIFSHVDIISNRTAGVTSTNTIRSPAAARLDGRRKGKASGKKVCWGGSERGGEYRTGGDLDLQERTLT